MPRMAGVAVEEVAAKEVAMAAAAMVAMEVLAAVTAATPEIAAPVALTATAGPTMERAIMSATITARMRVPNRAMTTAEPCSCTPKEKAPHRGASSCLGA